MANLIDNRDIERELMRSIDRREFSSLLRKTLDIRGRKRDEMIKITQQMESHFQKKFTSQHAGS